MSDPVGKILDKDGKDVSDRDRSGDGTIVVRRGLEKGHSYKFGSLPAIKGHAARGVKCMNRFCEECNPPVESKATDKQTEREKNEGQTSD